jgi:hypothetical protein
MLVPMANTGTPISEKEFLSNTMGVAGSETFGCWSMHVIF